MLEPVASVPGLWTSADWQEGQPGVYAVIAGASAYPFMDGGEKRRAETYGLGQLESSARTAGELFDWLRKRYRCEHLPVVWCWLLLSPTPAEREYLQQIGLSHYAEADYESLRKAIQRWSAVAARSATSGADSRTVFVFSGHGVQSNWEPVLLPSDYLDDKDGDPWQRCVSTAELVRWMGECPVAEHFALIDACRNEFSPLASKAASPFGIFPKISATEGPPPRSVSMLSATSPNAVAYQVPGWTETVFGQAVIEALHGGVPLMAPSLRFRDLVDYVRPRVRKLLIEAGGVGVTQSVRQRTEGEDELIVTEIDLAPRQALPPQAAGSAPAGDQGRLFSRADEPPEGLDPGTLRAIRAPSSMTFDRLQVVRGAVKLPVLSGMLQRYSIPVIGADKVGALERLRQPTAAERKTSIAKRIALRALQKSDTERSRRFTSDTLQRLWAAGPEILTLSGRAIPTEDVQILAVHTDPGGGLVEVDLALPRIEGGLLLVFENQTDVQRVRLAVALPTERTENIPIRLSMTCAAFANETVKLQRLDAQLGPCQWHAGYGALWTLRGAAEAGLWGPSSASTVRDMLAAFDADAGETATVAVTMLLDSVRREPWFPAAAYEAWLERRASAALGPDETIRRAAAAVSRAVTGDDGEEIDVGAAAVLLASLPGSGTPLFARSIEVGDRVTRLLRRRAAQPAQLRELGDVERWLAALLDSTFPAGDFIGLAGTPRPADLKGSSDEPLEVSEMLDLLNMRTAYASTAEGSGP